jgi:hypothetical protein
MKRIAAVLLALLLPACANLNSIYRANVPLSTKRPILIAMDAKQRNMRMVPDGENGWRLCAEAAPDVFTALSTSAAADFALTKTDAEKRAEARGAFALAEAAGTIERTQTINLLRESMYRTCERYLSGALLKESFVVQAGRDMRMMLGMLAIEQLTRAARPPSTIVSAGSTSAAISSTSEAVLRLIRAEGKLEAAEQKLKTANGMLPTDCSAPADADKAKCDEKAAAVKAATEERDHATLEVAEWDKIVKDLGRTNGAASQTGTLPGNSGGGSSGLSVGAIKALSSTVGMIVAKTFDTDESQLFCIQYMATYKKKESERALTSPLQQEENKVLDQCLKYFQFRIEADSRNLFRQESVVQRAAEIDVEIAEARGALVDAIASASPSDWQAIAADIRRFLPPFCLELTQAQCIDAIEEGEIDPVRSKVIAYLQSGRKG